MTTKSEFDSLLGDLDNILAKAQPIEMEGEGEEDAAAKPKAKGDDDDDADEGRGEGEGEDMMKSFRVTLDDGSEVDAYDATQMMKAMHAQSRQHAATLTTVQADLISARTVIAKQNELLKSLAERIGEQGTMLKALREQPAGRKSAATNAAPAAPAALDPGELMAKSLVAHAAGRLSTMDVAEIEVRLTGGHALQPHHLAAISAA